MVPEMYRYLINIIKFVNAGHVLILNATRPNLDHTSSFTCKDMPKH